MNIYDKTHDLVKCIKDSHEFKAFQAAKAEVDTDPAAKQMVKDFISKHMELEYEMMSGKPEDKEKSAKIQQMYQVILGNSKAASFMQAYMSLQRIIADVYKILGDSVAEGMDFFDKK